MPLSDLLSSILVPFIAIGLGFDAINGEYNRRTLSRILSQPIYRDALLFGKFAGGLFTLAGGIACDSPEICDAIINYGIPARKVTAIATFSSQYLNFKAAKLAAADGHAGDVSEVAARDRDVSPAGERATGGAHSSDRDRGRRRGRVLATGRYYGQAAADHRQESPRCHTFLLLTDASAQHAARRKNRPSGFPLSRFAIRSPRGMGEPHDIAPRGS